MLPFLQNLPELIITIGYFGVTFMIFAESGLFFGFIFPGDSLLFTAGLLASQNILDINTLIFLTTSAAIIGDSTGFLIGKYFKNFIEKKKGKFFINKKHLKNADRFYKKFGRKTLIIARFIPGVRTFAPVVAGMSKMKYTQFIPFSISGGLLWATGVPLIGYFLGERFPNIEDYILPIVGLIILISIIPPIIERRLLK